MPTILEAPSNEITASKSQYVFPGSRSPTAAAETAIQFIPLRHETSVKGHLDFLTLDTGLDKDSNVRITREQYEAFAGTNSLGVSSKDGLLVISLFEFACVVNLVIYGKSDYLKVLAQVLLPKLQELASPEKYMPATRFHSEILVKLLGRMVEFRKDGKSIVKGVFKGGTFVPLHEENRYTVRIGGEVPWEFTLGMSSLADSSYSITLCEQWWVVN